jgi:hypothetical protein
MAKAYRLTADQRDDLVAYLDGELEDGQTQQIDQVLARNEVARHEVEALARTWELLDLLQKPNATEGFTDRTITTLRVSEMATPITEQAWFGHLRKGAIAAVWVAVLSICAAVGYGITTKAVPNEQAELLTELPLIRNLDVYLEIENLDFVRELQRANQFTTTSMTESTEDSVSSGRKLSKSPFPSNRAALSEQYYKATQLSQADRDRVQRNWRTFQQMTPERQAHFRELHRQLTEEPDALRAVLETYAAWLPTLSPGKRDDLRQAKSSAARLDLVRSFKDEQDASRETQVFDLNLDLQRWKQRVPPGPYLTSDELRAMLAVVERRLPPREKIDLDQQGKMLPEERFVRILKLTFGEGSRIVDTQTAQEIIAEVKNEDIRKRLESVSPQFQRGAIAGTMASSITRLISDLQVEFFPSESQLEQVFVAQKGEDRHNLMQKSSHDLTRELLEKYWRDHGSDDARRLARARKDLWEFLGTLYGSRGGIGSFRDRNKDGERRFPSGGSFGGRPPFPPPGEPSKPSPQ